MTPHLEENKRQVQKHNKRQVSGLRSRSRGPPALRPDLTCVFLGTPDLRPDLPGVLVRPPYLEVRSRS